MPEDSQASFIWQRIQDTPQWPQTRIENCSGSYADFTTVGYCFLSLAEHLQTQCDRWWQHWQLRDYGDFSCSVSAEWDYPQKYLVKQVSVAFLDRYLFSEEPIPNNYPESRVMTDNFQLETECLQGEIGDLLNSAHSEDITTWVKLIKEFLKCNQEIYFSQLCHSLALHDWGNENYSAGKVYLGLLLSEEFCFQSSLNDFYGDFKVVRRIVF